MEEMIILVLRSWPQFQQKNYSHCYELTLAKYSFAYCKAETLISKILIATLLK